MSYAILQIKYQFMDFSHRTVIELLNYTREEYYSKRYMAVDLRKQTSFLYVDTIK